ncbi:hypothetical protein H7K45_19810 [Mycobacterium yunnanensis]|uniref:Alanine and proline rich membrane protein n=1 Tax=Mycobacterium yunnanensis TaxID=368477 RepID=A0A9X2Z5J9_9MYCO|nr:hypothetical protein [Mycobacterium yunnanensis]
MSRDRTPLLLGLVTLLSVVAIALSAWTLLKPARPAASNEPASSTDVRTSFTADQTAQAKTKICTVFDVVRKGVTLNTNLPVPGGPDDTLGTLAVAANARLALFNGGQYLLARIDPATPTELADAVRNFANNLLDVGANATAGALNIDPAQSERLRNADAINADVDRLCA